MEHILSVYNNVIEELNLTNKIKLSLSKGKNESEECLLPCHCLSPLTLLGSLQTLLCLLSDLKHFLFVNGTQ